MDGILIIDKPAGLTSHDVVARVRRILKTKRVGHTGTLDPFATGVLVLLIGKATRLAQFLDKDEKEYEATLKLGYETDTGDRTGSRKAQVASTESKLLVQNLECGSVVERDSVENVLAKFRGKMLQTPPMYSAKKIGGKKLYELARKGQEVERKAVEINITRLEVIEDVEPAADILRLLVACSAGTYVRTLAEDIGRALGVCAHLQELRRTRAGKFTISQSFSVEDLETFDNPAGVLVSMDEAVSQLPELLLTADRLEKTRNGLASTFNGQADDGQAVRMRGPRGELVAVGIYDASENAVRPKIVLI